MEKIKVIIADDNKAMTDFLQGYLEIYEEIEVLGSCYSSEEEIRMINTLKPEIVITDLARGNTLSGLEIIQKYKNQYNMPKFLVITGGEIDLIDTKIVDGLIKKPITDFSNIVKQLRDIKEQIIAERLPMKIQENKVNSLNSKLHTLLEKLRKRKKQ